MDDFEGMTADEALDAARAWVESLKPPSLPVPGGDEPIVPPGAPERVNTKITADDLISLLRETGMRDEDARPNEEPS